MRADVLRAESDSQRRSGPGGGQRLAPPIGKSRNCQQQGDAHGRAYAGSRADRWSAWVRGPCCLRTRGARVCARSRAELCSCAAANRPQRFRRVVDVTSLRSKLAPRAESGKRGGAPGGGEGRWLHDAEGQRIGAATAQERFGSSGTVKSRLRSANILRPIASCCARGTHCTLATICSFRGPGAAALL